MMKISGQITSLAVKLLLMTSGCRSIPVIDLTYQLKQGENIAWPTYPEYNFTILTRGHSPVINGWMESNKISLAEHTGTHMDAPSHAAKNVWRLHQVPVTHLVGPGVVIDIAEKAKKDPDYAITEQDLLDWESVHGKIPAGAVVLMYSGWGSRYPDKKRVFNSDTPSNPATFHFPGFSGEAVRWLAEQRVVIAVGGDTPSPDVAQSTDFAAHKILLAKNILILENVAHLDLVPPTGTIVVMGVLNIYDGSGGPMRLLAFSGAGDLSGVSGTGSSLLPLLATVMASCLLANRLQ